MAEKIELIEFNIDVDELVRNAQDVKQRLDEIKQEMREMVKAGEGSSEAFILNATSAKSLTREYNAQIKVLDQLNNETAETIPLQQQIDILMRREVSTIEELRKQNSALTKARNQASFSTKEGQAQIAEINARLDKNNAIIKENVSDLEQQKIGIGGYADGIKEALGGTSLFGGAVNDANQVMRQFSPVINLVKNDLNEAFTAVKNVTTGTEGMSITQKAATIASNGLSAAMKVLRVALISTGIGAIVVAVGSLVAYLTSTAEGVDRLNRVLTPLKTTFSAMLGVLQDLGKVLVDVFTNPLKSAKELANFVKDQLITQFRALGQMLLGILTFDTTLIRQGFDELTENVKGHINAVGEYFGEVGDRMGEAWKVGQQIAQLTEQINESELKLIRNQERLNAEMMENRTIAQDTNRTLAERDEAMKRWIAASKELNELEINHQSLIVDRLKLQQSVSGDSHEDMKQLAEEEARLESIRTSAAKREAQINRNIRRVSTDSRKSEREALANQEKKIQLMEEELALWEAQQSIAARTIQEEIELAQELADRRIAILDAELEAKKISQTKYNTEILGIQNELAQQQANATVEAAQRELDSIQDRLDIEAAISKAVGEERLKLEEEQVQQLAEARENFEAIQYMEGLISKQEYEDNLAAIARDRTIQEADLARERAEEARNIRMEQMELDLETEIAGLEARNAALWDIELAKIEGQRERDLEEARQRYTDEAMLQQALLNIEQQAQLARQQLELDKNKAIWESRASLLQSLGSIFGEQTTIGKAAGIAQATINAYVGMTEALKLPWPLNLAAAASTLSAGLKSVRSITSVDTAIKSPQIQGMRNVANTDSVLETINDIPPFAEGGLVRGGLPIRRSNGDNVLATLKTGEVVLNERQQVALGGSTVFRAIGVPGFANGGVAGGSTATLQRSIISGIDERMADTIGKAVLKGSRQGTQTGSRQGIVDASTERYLDNLSTF